MDRPFWCERCAHGQPHTIHRSAVQTVGAGRNQFRAALEHHPGQDQPVLALMTEQRGRGAGSPIWLPLARGVEVGAAVDGLFRLARMVPAQT